MKKNIATNYDNLQSVILLLAATVILPTICLLWFMTEAVKNDQLATRQKLVEISSGRANHFFVELPNLYFSGFAEHLNSHSIAEPRSFFGLLAIGPESLFQGMLIYDAGGKLLYPAVALQDNEQTDKSILPFDRRNKETIELVRQLAYPDNPQNVSSARAADFMRYRVFLAECLLENKDDRLFNHLQRALTSDPLYDSGPAETIVWQLEKLIALAARAGMSERLEPEIQSAQYRIVAYTNAFEAAFLYPTIDSLDGWPDRTVRRLTPGLDLYGFKVNIQNQTVVGISTPDKVLKILTAAVQDMQDDTINIQITDNFGSIIIGNSNNTEKPFLTISAGSFLPDFTVSVFFKNASVFESAAKRQKIIYLWTAVLVITLMTIIAIVSARSILRQARLNSLKNNFIATVTHELKTPLSSMRLLVDTLLDGSFTDQKRCREYLELISSENHRLSRLIDSFLTFSRMERNKQVFDLAPVRAAEIAKAAAEAVQTKFNHENCQFTASVDDNLPSIMADKDAMITVLVNLLDNAYKYSYDNKQIELKVFSENDMVCFSVKDNGIGMTGRQIKKIFDKFYQADTSLTRRTEGAGLGLSIVKFIVDAHNGKIDVESRPGEGSKFIVKLPIS
jgi:signal transduction histidine kinase